ncbi:hypothetical protein HDU82_006734 [Entophlyctis luteolus]|nr:hypothetical protein HDU82_006734 [Entophlyctis luteolus]
MSSPTASEGKKISSRAERNREAQRMYRRRQDERMVSLRQSAGHLGEQLRKLGCRMSGRIADNEYEIESIKTALERLRGLDGDGICAECVACVASPAVLKPTSPNSADGRYGPLQVSSCLEALSNLYSLRGSRLPQEFMDVVRIFSKAGDPAQAKRSFAQMFATRRKLLDHCSIVDRQLVIEIIEQFKRDNKHHLAVMYELALADGDLPTPADSLRDDDLGFVVGGESQLRGMLDALLKIESFANRRDLLEELLLQLQVCFVVFSFLSVAQ